MRGGMTGLEPSRLIADADNLEDVQLKLTNSTISQTIPFYSLLLSIDNPTVNLLSLDIEGAEYQVNSTLRFSVVTLELQMSVSPSSIAQNAYINHQAY